MANCQSTIRYCVSVRAASRSRPVRGSDEGASASRREGKLTEGIASFRRHDATEILTRKTSGFKMDEGYFAKKSLRHEAGKKKKNPQLFDGFFFVNV